ncbi:DUF551 domain-containing protein [Escherichia coli]|nr:DUF551 domain-containing protein [Escherichia coli]ELM7944652.1 DUF551 domain-containing protein [Escherichia coli]ELM7949336.1 DUF551 domain-containing protein [Escherichia coli]ELM7959034.1 DUF551 domain-containing protein [Escherichia coli]ELM7992224.1 DUF551 domain-containing protein [Escherichia coli]
MSTITREFTKEQLQQIIETDHVQCGEASALARIALASLEAEPVAWAHRLINKRNGVVHPWVYGSAEACPSEGDIFNIEVMPLYTAPPAPVSVPAAMEMDDDFDSALEHGKAVGWNAYRAAMLQGADRPQNEPQNIPENIPATQFKPVADLYGLTSPTGGETSFTFDAVEARDFIDGGWSCQEYVELERFQEAVSGNPPVIPDSWTKCSERMPEKDGKYLVASSFGIVTAWFDPAWSNKFQDCDTNCDEGMEDFEGKVFRVTHWQSLPAAPKQGDE